jgi:hypothetical protein
MDGNHTSESQPELPQPIQPGQTISPGASATSPVAQVAATAPAPEVLQAQSVVETPAPLPTPPLENDGSQEENKDSSEHEAFPQSSSAGPVSWTASEFIAHEKSTNWYVVLFGGAVIAAGLLWLITKDIISSVAILVAVGILASYSSRKPRELQYTLDDHGIMIGEKRYPYTAFRSFSVIVEGPFSSIELMPLKRFSPPISIYYDPANEDAIADALTPHLPFQPHEPDPVDKLIKRIRF